MVDMNKIFFFHATSYNSNTKCCLQLCGIVSISNKNDELKSLKPMPWSDKLQETIEFYIKVLAFSIGDQKDDWGLGLGFTLQRQCRNHVS